MVRKLQNGNDERRAFHGLEFQNFGQKKSDKEGESEGIRNLISHLPCAFYEWPFFRTFQADAHVGIVGIRSVDHYAFLRLRLQTWNVVT